MKSDLTALERAQLSLDGLSVGDALGEQFFGSALDVLKRIKGRQVPDPTWRYTDDTEEALSVVEVLAKHEGIDLDALIEGFVRRYQFGRGYGSGAQGLLKAIRGGADWRTEAAAMFRGGGSYGNGSAMRVAPVGAYFCDNLPAVREQAKRSAITTHTHPEGEAGAIAVAIAAALAWRVGSGEAMTPEAFMAGILEHVPAGLTKDGLIRAAEFPSGTPAPDVATVVGSGQLVSCQDTVPFAIWCAAHHLDSYEDAFWTTVSGLGDRDTTCAMVGGIVALSDRDGGIPSDWLGWREDLPELELSS